MSFHLFYFFYHFSYRKIATKIKWVHCCLIIIQLKQVWGKLATSLSRHAPPKTRRRRMLQKGFSTRKASAALPNCDCKFLSKQNESLPHGTIWQPRIRAGAIITPGSSFLNILFLHGNHPPPHRRRPRRRLIPVWVMVTGSDLINNYLRPEIKITWRR